MRTARVRSFGVTGALSAVLGGLGCGGSEPGQSASSAGRICAHCVERAGGETSDFGDGSEFLPSGSGISSEPTPCDELRETEQIDEARARALGFGAQIDRLETSFDIPFGWTPGVLEEGEPATGYAPVTRLRGATHPVSFEHRVPALDSCEDLLGVGMDFDIETADGALVSPGRGWTLPLGRESSTPTVYTELDLNDSQGTLQIFPVPRRGLTGYLLVNLYFRPEGLRAYLNLGTRAELDDGTRTYWYEPLSGRGPLDRCPVAAGPIGIDAPIAANRGKSLSAIYPELLSWLELDAPFTATWTEGAATNVRAEIGQPSEPCEGAGGIFYTVPLAVTSDDGRVNVRGEATGRIAFANGAWSQGSVGIQPDVVEAAEFFAASSGISGVDFGGLGGGRWYTSLNFARGAARATGEVAVTGVDIDGHVMGSQGTWSGIIARLRW